MSTVFLQNLTGGRYRPGSSPVHRMAVGAKLLWALALLAGLAFAEGWTLIAFTAGILAAWRFASGLAWADAARQFRGAFWFLFVVVALPALFMPQDGVDTPQIFTVSAEGARQGALLAGRIFVMFLVSSMMLQTTPPENLVGWAGGAAGRTGWLADWIAVTVGAFQLLPVVCEEAEKTFSALFKRPRGGTWGNLRVEIKASLLRFVMDVLLKPHPELYMEKRSGGEDELPASGEKPDVTVR